MNPVKLRFLASRKTFNAFKRPQARGNSPSNLLCDKSSTSKRAQSTSRASKGPENSLSERASTLMARMRLSCGGKGPSRLQPLKSRRVQ